MNKMSIIPYWYELTEIERRAIIYWEAYERARNSRYIDAKERDRLFEHYMFWRLRVEKN